MWLGLRLVDEDLVGDGSVLKAVGHVLEGISLEELFILLILMVSNVAWNNWHEEFFSLCI